MKSFESKVSRIEARAFRPKLTSRTRISLGAPTLSLPKKNLASELPFPISDPYQSA